MNGVLRTFSLSLFLCFIFSDSFSQGVTIGSNNPPDSSAILDLQSVNGGFLMPRLSTVQRNTISSPAVGLQIYNVDLHCVQTYFPSGWKSTSCECTTPPPTPVAISGPAHVCLGQAGISLYVQPVPGAYSYTWTIGNQDTLVSGQGNDSIIINVSQFAGSRTISVIAHNGCGSSPAYTTSLNVSNPNPAFTINAYPPLVNNASTFAAVQSGGAYSWTFPSGTPASGNTQSVGVTWTNAGTYLVGMTIVDAEGCQSHLDSHVTVSSCNPYTLTFTNCGAAGNAGPNQTQCNSAYGPGVVTVTSGIQYWTVPTTGTYVIEAAGAQGAPVSATTGGLGAIMRGSFVLTAGEIIKILVGQQGDHLASRIYISSPGGGGSFVVRNTGNAALVVAGGGGGTGNERPVTSNAVTTTAANSGSTAATGGTGGNGGTAGTTSAGAGGGFLTDGASAGSAGGGYGYVNGGGGGITNASYNPAGGGFGGGGSITGGANSRYGGGGGYSGGGGSSSLSGATTGLWGGGGGSYNAGTNQVNQAGVRQGHGYVTITYTCQ